MITVERQSCLSSRQEKILDIIVREYVKSAQPVSSKFLERKHRFGVCPATIRIEMQKLTDTGLIFQPHISAGRIPTDKGYRFFVDNLLSKEFLKENFKFEGEETLSLLLPSLPSEAREGEDDFGEGLMNPIKFLQQITKNLASVSSSLALGYLLKEKILWKDGWGEIIKEPEFTEKRNINNFFEMIDALEKEIENLVDAETNVPLRVYIGKENPFPRAKEFSMIISRCRFCDEEGGILAILGPKRMDYDKNIGSLNSLIKLLEKF